MGSTPAYEQETSICFERTGTTVRVWTSDTTVMTKLDKLASDPASPWTCTKISRPRNCPDEIFAKEYEAPKEFLVFRRAKREMTEEQKEAARERFAKYRRDRQAREHAE